MIRLAMGSTRAIANRAYPIHQGSVGEACQELEIAKPYLRVSVWKQLHRSTN